MENPIKVLITSQNPAKVRPTEEAFTSFFSNPVIDTVEIETIHSDRKTWVIQPIGEQETYVSSRQRVQECQPQFPEYNYYVGIEGGVTVTSKSKARIIIYTSIGSGIHIETIRGCEIPLPRAWYDELVTDPAKELGEIVTKASGVPNIKQKQGAIGFLTNSTLTRAAVIKHTIICALIPFLNPNHFFPSGTPERVLKDP